MRIGSIPSLTDFKLFIVSADECSNFKDVLLNSLSTLGHIETKLISIISSKKYFQARKNDVLSLVFARAILKVNY